MKTIVLILCLCPCLAIAQTEESMQSLKHLEGNWKGSGWAMSRDGQRNEFVQTEAIRSKLGGKIMIVEGIGRSPETNEVTFNAFAVFSFDSLEQKFDIRSYLATGESTDATGKFVEGRFIWKIETPGGTVRYTLTADDATWNEFGEFSRDGTQWFKFMEMNLTKSSD